MISGKEFENIVYEVLKVNKYNVELTSTKKGADQGYDISILENNVLSYIVEVKLYTSNSISRSIIRNALNQLSNCLSRLNVSKGILIVPIYLAENEIERYLVEYGIVIWDQVILLKLASENEELFDKLKIFLIQAGLTILPIIDSEKKDKYEKYVSNFPIHPLKKGKKPDLYVKNLIDEIKKIPSGRAKQKSQKYSDWRMFEIKCKEALEYLFKENLTGWKDQETTDDDLNRFDLICKINSDHTFWLSLIQDFKSRYILFEFKNYTDPIKQSQILTTEKYLYLTALRTVAFIISKEGVSENALKTTQGILRETGKLIIVLHIDDLIEMLKKKDKGDDPIIILSEKLDSLLMALSK